MMGLADAAIAIPLSATTTIGVSTVPLSSQGEIRQRLRQLPGWQTDGKTLFCTVQLRNFVSAISFVNRLIEPAEQAAHHPDLLITFNKVKISLTTHSVNGVTAQDLELATTISQLKEFPGCQT